VGFGAVLAGVAAVELALADANAIRAIDCVNFEVEFAACFNAVGPEVTPWGLIEPDSTTPAAC